MGIFNNFPWTNFHEINLDWLLKKVKGLEEKTKLLTDHFIVNISDDGNGEITIDKTYAEIREAYTNKQPVVFNRDGLTTTLYNYMNPPNLRIIFNEPTLTNVTNSGYNFVYTVYVLTTANVISKEAYHTITGEI